MSNVAFLWIFSRGIELGVIVLCLLPFRVLLRKKVPRAFSYLLWCALPVNIGYNLCLFAAPKLNHWIADKVDEIDPIIIFKESLDLFKCIWSIGILIILLFMLASYVRLRRYLTGSIHLYDNIYLNARISTPFSMGVIRPKIFLPSSIKEEYYTPIVLHECAHIARKDIWMKYFAIAFRAVFWFQPLLWIAYRLFINDMEMACDEAVVRKRDFEFRKEYARALLEVSDQEDKLQENAIGYGSGVIKIRIRNIVQYERVNYFVRCGAAMLCAMFMMISLLISWQIPRVVQAEQGTSVENSSFITQSDMTQKKK